MTLRYFPILLLILFLSNVKAQTTNDDVLLMVDNEPVLASEFIRVYNKNLDLVQDESQKDVDEYLTLFKNYKLKLREAKSLGIHNKQSYIRELGNYKKQLAKSFVTDSKVTDALVKEAYERVSHEVKASHILIKVAENADPEDTLLAYKSILKLRDRAIKEGFETVRKEVHNGQTVFGEDLGYFSGFRMVYKFENAAFNTPVGAVSEPFRTRFGYHFVKVFETRESRGEITVAHIMSIKKQGDSSSADPEVRIQEIYKKLNQGEDFESLAKQFSDDKSSANKGGLLDPFSGGQLSAPEFEDTAFALQNIGDVSLPIETKYGWHIIKLIAKKPIGSFEDLKPELEVKVKRDERSKLIDNALVDKLKVRYEVNNKQPALDYFTSILTDDYFKRTWSLPVNFEGYKPFIKIGNKQLTFLDFGEFLVKSQRNVSSKLPYSILVSNQYQAFLSENLIQYQEDNLENENEDFANIVNEYRDGLLLFDLMETTIWNTAQTDSIEIQNFYNNNKNNYVWPERMEGLLASSAKQNVLKKVAKLLENNMDIEQIKKLVNNNGEVHVIFTTGNMDLNHQALPSDFNVKKGLSKIYKHNDAFVLAQVKEVFPTTLKTFEEAKGSVISDYQTHKENNWLQTLSEKYRVILNQETLNKVKLQIKNQ